MIAALFGIDVTNQLLFDGVINGLIIGLLAMGIVLVYRSTRVINFAVGNMGLVGATLLVIMTVNYGVPFWLAAIVALVVGTLFGTIMELIVVRRLFTAPRVIMLVATIGIGGLALAIVFALPDLDDLSATYPSAIDKTWTDVLGTDVQVRGAQLAVLIVVPIVTIALGWFLNRTLVGRTVKASAENPDLARVQGINPKVVSTAVWSIAGFVATLTMILIAAGETANNVTVLGPNTLVRALAAAVIAGLVSFPRAMFAGIAIGLFEAIVKFNYLDKPGLIDLLLFIAVLIAVALQSRGSREETQTFSFTPKVRQIPEQLRNVWWVKHCNKMFLGVLVVIAAFVPLVITAPSRQLLYATIGCFAICALSLTVLTGWAGQLSLGQMAFAGFGALFAAGLARGQHYNLGILTIKPGEIPFPLAILIAAFLTAGLAVIIGVGALRVRGLLLAVSTFAFGVTSVAYFYRQPFLSGGASSLVSFPRGKVLGIDLSSQRNYYWAVLVVLVIAVAVVSHLRKSGIGRTTIAVRDNENTAGAYTVGRSSTKLRAFALAGFLAGLGGAMLAGAIESVPYTERYFLVGDSLLLVSMVVIGGIASPMGAVLGAVWVVGMPAFFPDNELVPLLTSSLGLLVLLLYFPGGFVQVGYAARDGLLEWAARRRGEVDTTRRAAAPAALKRQVRPPVASGVPALEVRDVRVRFGGNVAVDGVTLAVGNDEIVGLIGTNGAGKSTLMNAIGGFVRAKGTVELHGDDVTRHGPARRAREGLGRTFQAAQLFPELTVRETVEVALEARGRTGFLSTALFLPHASMRERRRRADADDLIGFLGLGRYANNRISDLSTGTRRIVELAGLLALDARVLCLDEPTAGVAQRETEAFGPLIKEIRRELGASVLIIEHDMPLIMSISDRVYCLEVGKVIAEGVPYEVRHDPKVVASYLGMDERAIARSGEAAVSATAAAAPAAGPDEAWAGPT
jgi:ABC-type branched-subunit amino acid transport system ATPase component/ABC-type branched-subunit amino acid transport system permease subunit